MYYFHDQLSRTGAKENNDLFLFYEVLIVTPGQWEREDVVDK